MISAPSRRACFSARPASSSPDTPSEAEVVLDPRGGARLAAGRLALDHEQVEALGGAVHGGREAGRPRTDDDGVVLRPARLGPEVEQLRDAAQLGAEHRLGVEPEHPRDLTEVRLDDGLVVQDAHRRQLVLLGERATPLLDGVRLVGRDPPVYDVVSVEKAAQLGAARVDAVAENDGARRRRRGREAGEACGAADAVRREAADLGRDLGRDRGDAVVVVRLDPEDAGDLGRAEPDREDGAESDRDLPEHVAGAPVADDALDPVHELDRLDPPGEEPEERALGGGVRRILARLERDVRGDAREPFALLEREVGEDRDGADLLGRHHRRPPPRASTPPTRAHGTARAAARPRGGDLRRTRGPPPRSPRGAVCGSRFPSAATDASLEDRRRGVEPGEGLPDR